jgi:hypothetical protein
MSIVPTKPVPVPNPAETLEECFRRLEATWIAETAYLSSSTDILNHPAFLEIIRLGEPVVPLIFRDWEHRPRFWAWALSQITGVNPVPESDRRNLAKVSEAWLRWGHEQGYR